MPKPDDALLIAAATIYAALYATERNVVDAKARPGLMRRALAQARELAEIAEERR